MNSWAQAVKITEDVLIFELLQAGKWEPGKKSVRLKTECFDMLYLQ